MNNFINNLGLWFMMIGLVGIIGYSSSRISPLDDPWGDARVVAGQKYAEAKAYVLTLPEQAHAFWKAGPWNDASGGRLSPDREERWNLLPGAARSPSEDENK